MRYDQLALNINSNDDFRKVLTNPILDIAARLWEEERYRAFKTCYKTMRKLDDLVDDLKISLGRVPGGMVAMITEKMHHWLEMVRLGTGDDCRVREFNELRTRFRIPFWPWERLCQAMNYDLRHTGFDSFRTFLKYSEGAAVAPASVFVHLCGVRRNHKEYSHPNLNIRKTARDLALFSYLVHILRDFKKDQERGLNYFPKQMLDEHGISRERLKQIALGQENPRPYDGLIKRYLRIGRYYQHRARWMLDQIRGQMEARYHLSLEMIYGLYLQVFERIESAKTGRFDFQPSADAVKSRIDEITEKYISSPGGSVLILDVK